MLPMEDGTYSLDTFGLGSEHIPVCSVGEHSHRCRVLMGARVILPGEVARLLE